MPKPDPTNGEDLAFMKEQVVKCQTGGKRPDVEAAVHKLFENSIELDVVDRGYRIVAGVFGNEVGSKRFMEKELRIRCQTILKTPVMALPMFIWQNTRKTKMLMLPIVSYQKENISGKSVSCMWTIRDASIGQTFILRTMGCSRIWIFSWPVLWGHLRHLLVCGAHR